MEVYRRSSGLLLLLGLSLLATTLQGVQGEVEAEGPSESECRPYIEKALKELEAGELAVGSSAELGESKEDIPTVEITDDSDHEEGDGEKHDINEDGQESKENKIVSEKKSDPEVRQSFFQKLSSFFKKIFQKPPRKTEEAANESKRSEDKQDDASPVRGDQPAVDVEDSKEIETDNNDKQDYSKETGDEQEEAAQKEDSDSKEETDKEDDSKEVLDNKDDSTEEQIRTKREIDTEDDTKEDQDDDTKDEQDDDRKDEYNNAKEEHDNDTKEEQDEESKENGDIQAESKEEADHESENIQTESVEELVEKVEAESLTESLDQADDDSKEDGKSVEADDQKGDDNDSIEQAEDKKNDDKDSKEEESQGHNLQPDTTENEEEDTKDNSKHEENADKDSQEDRKDDDITAADDDNKDDDNYGKDDDATDNDSKQDETKDDDIQDDSKENEMVDTNEIKEDSKEDKEDKIDEQSEDNTVDQESQEDTKDLEDSKDDEATQTVNDDKIDEDTKGDPQSSKEGDRDDDQAESNEDGNEKKDLEVENSDEKHDQSMEDGVPVEDLSLDTEIPTDLRDRRHVEQLLKLDDDHSESEELINRVSEITLRDLKKLYENAIKPLETVYKYRDLSNRHFGDSEIFSKPLILFMGPWSGGKSSIINYLTNNEYNDTSLRTGAEPSPAYFNILMYGEEPEIIDGAELAADFTFSGLQKFGQGLEERLRGVKIPSKLLERVNIVEIPGILEVRKQVSRVFPFNDACQWFIDRGDIIFLVYDPSKLDVGPETEAILDQLKGREHQTRIILNKADQVKPEELMRVQGALIWNISPLMSSPQPPIMYTTSLWSRPYEPWAPVRLLQAQERAFLRDLRGAVDKRIENKIASARRFAVRVRNHAKMVDCYLTTYYNHKSVFGNRKQVADAIIEHPQDYHIYEGLSTLTNISRYDLPDPDVYRDFFKLNPLYEFQQLSATCTYFRGCPINRLDIAIAYDLPELLGTHKKRIENALAEAGTGSQQTSAPGS